LQRAGAIDKEPVEQTVHHLAAIRQPGGVAVMAPGSSSAMTLTCKLHTFKQVF
jgi:hypothetical protein